jgi:ankyrin repeat protein
VTLLILECANIHQTNNNGETPISIACEGGHLEVVKLLILEGANINIRRCKYSY